MGLFDNPNKEQTKGTDWFLNFANEQKENHLELVKALAEMGQNIKALTEKYKQIQEGYQLETVLLAPYDNIYYADGYKFNSLYISDVAENDDPQLVVTYNGVTYTTKLVSGENVVNIPDTASYHITTDSGNSVTASLIRYNMSPPGRVLFNDGVDVAILGNDLKEQHTQADAVAGVVTFAKAVRYLEIYNTDATNTGVFAVNGINITVPPNESFKAQIGGTPAASVSVSGSTSYILSRYE